LCAIQGLIVYVCTYAYERAQFLSNRYVNIGLLGKAVSAGLKLCSLYHVPVTRWRQDRYVAGMS